MAKQWKVKENKPQQEPEAEPAEIAEAHTADGEDDAEAAAMAGAAVAAAPRSETATTDAAALEAAEVDASRGEGNVAEEDGAASASAGATAVAAAASSTAATEDAAASAATGGKKARRGNQAKKKDKERRPPTLFEKVQVTDADGKVKAVRLGEFRQRSTIHDVRNRIARLCHFLHDCVTVTNGEGEVLSASLPLGGIDPETPIMAIILPTVMQRVHKGLVPVRLNGEPVKTDLTSASTTHDMRRLIAKDANRPWEYVQLIDPRTGANMFTDTNQDVNALDVVIAKTVEEFLAVAELRFLSGEPVPVDGRGLRDLGGLQLAIARMKDTFPKCVKFVNAQGDPVKDNFDLSKIGAGEVVTVLVRDSSKCKEGVHEWQWRATGWGSARFCMHCDKEDLQGPCFAGDASIALADGTACAAASVGKGTLVLTPSGAAEVLCVVKTLISGGCCHLAKVAEDTFLTPGHPVRINGSWTTAARAGPVDLMLCPAVYNFVLAQGHILFAGGCECVTLGHDLQEEGVRHPYLGSQRVVDHLRAQAGWEAGVVERVESRCGCGERGRAEGERRQMELLCSGGAETGGFEMSHSIEQKLLRLHQAAMEGTGVRTAYRERPVEINGEEHAPPSADSVPALVAAFSQRTATLLANGADPFTAAAFCLWWVAHVHPFLDGNGRSARGLCCAALMAGAKLGPDEKLESIHDFFRKEGTRDEYIEGLREANKALGAFGCYSPSRPLQAGEPSGLRRLVGLLRTFVASAA